MKRFNTSVLVVFLSMIGMSGLFAETSSSEEPKEKPYFHQISLDCLEKLVDCIGRFNKGEIDADTSLTKAEKSTEAGYC